MRPQKCSLQTATIYVAAQGDIGFLCVGGLRERISSSVFKRDIFISRFCDIFVIHCPGQKKIYSTEIGSRLGEIVSFFGGGIFGLSLIHI